MTLASIEKDAMYADPSIRDAFLRAIDGNDPILTARLAQKLLACGNALPGLTREQLGLPVGCTYGVAARFLLSSIGSAKTEAPTSVNPKIG